MTKIGESKKIAMDGQLMKTPTMKVNGGAIIKTPVVPTGSKTKDK